MKKLVFLFGILFLYTVVNGQIKKGTLLFGVQGNYYGLTENSATVVNDKNSTIAFAVGRAFRENNVYGISVGYLAHAATGNQYYVGGYSSTGDLNTWSISIYNRRYKKLMNELNLFHEIGVGFSYSKKNFDYSTDIKQKDNGNSVFLYNSLGLDYRVHKKVHAELLLPNLVRLSYFTSKIEYLDSHVVTTNNSSIKLNTGLGFSSLAIGVRVML